MVVLNFEEVRRIVLNGKKIELSALEKERVVNCHNFLESFCRDKIVYGINTGFGPMAQYRVDDKHLIQLQYNIIRSHSTGAGDMLPWVYVRAAMVARLQTFLQGKSGVHVEVVEKLQQFINEGIYPIVYQHGSVGASGDLVQLSHIALALIGEGEVYYKGEVRSTGDVLKQLCIAPLSMHIREGLALTNGTAVMSGIGLVNLMYAKKLLNWSIAASVMLNEIAESYDDFMSEVLNGLKNHNGQNRIAESMRLMADGSQRMRKRYEIPNDGEGDASVFKHKVQPYYSLRCIPQILGPVWDTITNTEEVLINELNAVDDNPIVDPETQSIYHGGNFHGDYVSFEMDKLKIAITKLTMLAERQMNYLFHDRINGILPPFVNLGVLGLNYGLQAAQFTATSTTAECQTLSNPMYVHSIPNNNDNQDIVSMGTNSALLAKTVIENSFQVMAIHFMAIAQAIDCLKIEEQLAPLSKDIYRKIRLFIPATVEDLPKYKEIASVVEFLKENEMNNFELH